MMFPTSPVRALEQSLLDNALCELPADDGTRSFEQVIEMIGGATMSQAIATAAELELPDLLAAHPLTLTELSAATQCHAASLRRLLRALCGIGICTEAGSDIFGLTSMGAQLQRDAPSRLRSYVLWWSRHRWPLWGKLLQSVRSGESFAGADSTGMKQLGDDEAAGIFHGAMAGLTRIISRGVLQSTDFLSTKCLVDVGGGTGELMGVILQAHPAVQGVLFEQSHAIDGARNHLAQAGVADRCQMISGDFFESVPAVGDTWVLKAIVHDWDDDAASCILRNCRKTMATGTRLLLVEQVMPPSIAHSMEDRRVAMADLNMLVMLGGKERTSAEFRALLERSGFRMGTTTPAALGYSVIESWAA